MWEKVEFNTVIADLTGGQTKIQKKAYLPKGSFPVIDQGQSNIAGYTNFENAVFNGKLPVVLFGDHTLALKYIDFPFALGADGVKALSVNSIVCLPKFIYYYWVSRNLVSRGYSRHFKYLKEIPIPVFPYSEQEKIVEILDAADDLRRRRAKADKKAANILPALFYKMFGDPATNPKGWKVKTLGKLVIETPQYGANASGVPWSKGMPRYIRITDINADGVLREDGIVTLDMDDWEPYRLYDGDLLFARSGNTVGKTYLYKENDGLCAFAGYLIRFKLNIQEINPLYAFAFTQTPVYQAWVDSKKRTAGQPNINGKEYASLQIPCPPITLQNNFVELAEQALNICIQNSQTISNLNQTFDVLMYHAFSGKLTAGWRERNKDKLEKELAEQMKAIEAANAGNAGKGKKNRKT